MATTSTLPVATRRPQSLSHSLRSSVLTLSAVTVAAFLLLGYHPYAEDGGIYASAAAQRLTPSLFPVERGFAVAHSGRSLFIPLLAAVTRALHVPLEAVLLLGYVATLAATITAAAYLSRLLFPGLRAQLWAQITLAVCLGLPVAGTSLYLADPYLTARSLSTPLLLFSVVLLLRRQKIAAFLLLAVAFVFHPLMAAWAMLLLATVLTRRSARPVFYTILLAVVSLAAMAALQWFAPGESTAVRAASLSRDYWFASEWDWYELVGLIAPLMLLPTMGWLAKARHVHPAFRDVAIATAAAGIIVTIGSLLLIHPGDHSFLLARLQPLRLFHSVYLLFVLLLGGLLSHVRVQRIHAGWLTALAAACGLLFMQRQIYPSSQHVELPWSQPSNGYEQAFLWVRFNTPTDALFAMDADYTTAPGEDAQLFRAIALRSALPDAAKDGGIASVMPQLARGWQMAAAAQADLNTATDAQRIARVKPMGATWVLLPTRSKTGFACPYANTVAKVCKLP